jgi:hypothetical protein
MEDTASRWARGLEDANDAGKGGEAIRSGVMTNLLNPKALMFCALLLPQFISPQRDLAAQYLTLGVVLVGLGFAFDVLYAFAASRLAKRFWRPAPSQESQGFCSRASLDLQQSAWPSAVTDLEAASTSAIPILSESVLNETSQIAVSAAQPHIRTTPAGSKSKAIQGTGKTW